MRLIKRILAKYMPMRFIEYRFTDSVSGKPVGLYLQIDGLTVLADSRFSLFRVPRPNTELHYKLYHGVK